MTIDELKYQLENGDDGEYVFDVIEGNTCSGIHFRGCYGNTKMNGENMRRWLFYLESDIGPYVLEVWQRLDHDTEDYAEEVIYRVVESVTIHGVSE